MKVVAKMWYTPENIHIDTPNDAIFEAVWIHFPRSMIFGMCIKFRGVVGIFLVFVESIKHTNIIKHSKGMILSSS